MRLRDLLLTLTSMYLLTIYISATNAQEIGKRAQTKKTVSPHNNQPLPQSPQDLEQLVREAAALLQSGGNNINQGKLDQAIEDCQASLNKYYGMKHTLGVIFSFHCLADAYFKRKKQTEDYSQAATYASRALFVIDELMKPELQIEDESLRAQIKDINKSVIRYHLLLIAGQSLNYIGEYTPAHTRLQEAVQLASELNRIDLQASARTALGRVLVSLKKYSEAINLYKMSLMGLEECPGTSCDQKRSEKDYRREKAYVRDETGIAYAEQSDFRAALREFEIAKQELENISDNYGKLYAMGNIGNVHMAMRNLPEARKVFTDILKGFKQDSLRQAITLLNIATVAYLESGETIVDPKTGKVLIDRKSKLLGEAEQRCMEAGKLLGNVFRPELSLLHNLLGLIYETQGYLNNASKNALFDRARKSFEKSKVYNKDGLVARLNLSSLDTKIGGRQKYLEAIEETRRVGDEASQKKQHDILTRAKLVEGVALRKLGRLREAAEALRESVKSAENERAMTGGGWQNTYLFFDEKAGSHNELVDVLIDLHQKYPTERGLLEEAFKYAELSKGRVMLDMMQQGSKNIIGSLSVQEADLLLPNEQTALLEFVVSPNRIVVFLLTKKKGVVQLDAFQPNITMQELLSGPGRRQRVGQQKESMQELVDSLDKLIASQGRTLQSEINDSLMAIYAGLFGGPEMKGLRDKLAGMKHLVIVPDGPLWNVPFQALKPSKDIYLIDQYAVSYAFSLTSLREQIVRRRRKAAAGNNLLAVADPSLKGGENEILGQLVKAGEATKKLVTVYGSGHAVKIFPDDRVTEQDVANQAGQYRILHFTAHGLVDLSDPMRSGLVLEPNGLWEADEIIKLNLNADIVIIASCNSALGKTFLGEGAISLAWAFQAAGCKSTVATQWEAFDYVIATLMKPLHLRIKQTMEAKTTQGLSRAEALTQAILEVKKVYPYPGLWAPFIIIGDAY